MADMGGAWATAIVSLGTGIANFIQQQEANNIARDEYNLATDEYNLNLAKEKKSANDSLRSIDREISSMQMSILGNQIEKEAALIQVKSYDKWLENYDTMYNQQMASRQVQTDQLKASGQESYENFINAIGSQNAQAGFTGRLGGVGTSQGAVTQAIDKKLVDYVGEDRQLDANGGIYGRQLTAANMETQQLQKDLQFQKDEITGNRSISSRSADQLQESIFNTQTAIYSAEESRHELEDWIDENLEGKEKVEKREEEDTSEADYYINKAKSKIG
jgi:hypothetical protein